ncbi:ion transporter [Jiulongibacter sediminis]|uniref:Potassium channel protein n=1 Tax=Jiulongibacter sediminis TaxID=1605367 RepID=A0A0P7C1G6_9BACT|nr:ion transporter [Jiulongibacter sediminis]KPM48488.1 potassium channel protein [Jiulongibacter sediminis]
MGTIRKEVNEVLEIKFQRKRGISFVVNISLSILIFLNTVAIILHTVPSISDKYNKFFLDFEVFSVAIFTVEYLLRVWSCVEQPEYRHWFFGRVKFVFSAWGIIDFLAIFPFFYSYFATDLGFVRILRILRIFRLFRVSRYFHALRVIQNVVKAKKEELLLSMSFIVFLLLILSSLVFYIEHDAQPEAFSSIPDSLWWGVNAMTTVGYGDMHPITPLGKVLGGLMAILGVSIFALPTGIMASGFAEQIRGRRTNQGKVVCPHCGETYYLAERHKAHH